VKDYLVFLGNNYYPLGGWEDLREDFDSLEESLNYIKSQDGDDAVFRWAHVVYKNKIIKQARTTTEDFKTHIWEFEDYQYE
jgi:hypothetical protein